MSKDPESTPKVHEKYPFSRRSLGEGGSKVVAFLPGNTFKYLILSNLYLF